MKKVALLICLSVILGFGCSKPKRVASTIVEFISVDSSYDAIADQAYIKYIDSLDALMGVELNTVIGYCPYDLVIKRPECELLNWATDALYEHARTTFKGRVDVAIMNFGGLRCNLKKGKITIREMYTLMPFNNNLAILELKGQDLLELCQIICMVGGQGISHMKIVAENNQLISATVDGKPINPDKNYYIATSDFLIAGKDDLTPLGKHTNLWHLQDRIRDIFLKTVKEQDTLKVRIDGRITLNTL